MPEPTDVMPDPPALADRLSRLETRLATTDEQLAQRVIAILSEKAAQQRATNGVPGLNAAALIAARVVQTVLPDAPPGTAPPTSEPNVRTWLLGILSELRLMVRMYFDPRYRLSRVSQFGIPAVIGLFVFNYLLFNLLLVQIPLFSPVTERLCGVVLAVGLYKMLAREAVRYRQVLEYLTAYGHG